MADPIDDPTAVVVTLAAFAPGMTPSVRRYTQAMWQLHGDGQLTVHSMDRSNNPMIAAFAAGAWLAVESGDVTG